MPIAGALPNLVHLAGVQPAPQFRFGHGPEFLAAVPNPPIARRFSHRRSLIDARRPRVPAASMMARAPSRLFATIAIWHFAKPRRKSFGFPTRRENQAGAACCFPTPR